MDLEKILKYLLPIVPEPLRRHVATGIVLLTCVAMLEGALEGMPWAETFRSRYFLISCLVMFSYFVAISFLKRSSLRLCPFLTLVFVFLAGATAAGYGVWLRHDERYNQLGFYQGRNWILGKAQPGNNDTRWQWEIEAVEDLSSKDVIVRMSPASCQFDDFAPEVSLSDFRPTITDISVDRMHSDTWKIQDFRKPATVTFNLTEKGRKDQSICALPQINMTSKQ